MNMDFEKFLIDYHADRYDGLDDDMPDSFDDWVGGLDVEGFIRLANKFAAKVARQTLEDCQKAVDRGIEKAFK